MTDRNSALPESRLKKLNERRFWEAAFLAAQVPTLLKGRRITPQGAAHIASDYADAERRRRWR